MPANPDIASPPGAGLPGKRRAARDSPRRLIRRPGNQEERRVCGIAGILRRGPRASDRDVVAGMLEEMRLRGPDGEGLVQEGGLTLGHKRLAIIDLSPAAAQPMESADSRLLISFNGEIYNYRELAGELSLDPASLRSSSDTEILLHAWSKWGPGCLDRLVGQWAFAVYDRTERVLWLARDRFGEKPLFYHDAHGVFAFASTLGGLMRAPWVSRELCPDALAEYLTLRYVVSPRTILREAGKLPPGHFMRVDERGREAVRWWSPRFRPASGGGERRRKEEAVEEFGARLVQASRRCMISDVPAALLLSDGLDSNGILAALKTAGIPCDTFTYRASTHGAAGADEDDLVHVSFEEMAGRLEPAFANLTEPVGDGAVFSTYHLIREARAGATVFLSGHGGDEMLAGYRLSQDRFRLSAMSRLSRVPVPALDKMVATYTSGEESPAARREALASLPPRRAPEAARYLHQHPLPPSDLRTLFSPAPPPGPYLGVVDRLYADCDGKASDLDRMQEVALRTFLSELTTTLADSCAMASSAESRMPYLDRDLAEFVFGLPRWVRVGRLPGLLNTKLILRWWGKGRIPDETLKRGKSGFRYGNIRQLLKVRGKGIRSLIMDSAALRGRLPGLEAWLGQETAVFRRGREGTYWALLALAIWGERAGI